MRNIFSRIEKFKTNIAFYTDEYKSITYKNLLEDTEKFKKNFQKKKQIIIFLKNENQIQKDNLTKQKKKKKINIKK